MLVNNEDKLDTQDIYRQVVYSKCLKRNIKIIMIVKTENKKVGKSLLYSTDKDLSAMKKVEY